MSWIEVEKALPVLWLKVRVRGKYTPLDYPYPVAMLRDVWRTGKPEWSSTETRGTTAITHWWLDSEDEK